MNKIDEAKLTAYALGELNEPDHAAVKAEVEKSPECRRAVEEIQRAAAMLAEEFSAEELPDLTFAQQRKIENQIRQPVEGSNRELCSSGISKSHRRCDRNDSSSVENGPDLYVVGAADLGEATRSRHQCECPATPNRVAFARDPQRLNLLHGHLIGASQ